MSSYLRCFLLFFSSRFLICGRWCEVESRKISLLPFLFSVVAAAAAVSSALQFSTRHKTSTSTTIEQKQKGVCVCCKKEGLLLLLTQNPYFYFSSFRSVYCSENGGDRSCLVLTISFYIRNKEASISRQMQIRLDENLPEKEIMHFLGQNDCVIVSQFHAKKEERGERERERERVRERSGGLSKRGGKRRKEEEATEEISLLEAEERRGERERNSSSFFSYV